MMHVTYLTVVFAIIAICHGNYSGQFVKVYGEGWRSVVTPSNITDSVTEVECSGVCVRDDTCEGFNVRHMRDGRGLCETLSSVTRPSVDVVAETASVFYQRVDTHLCADQTLCYVYGFDLTFDEALELCPKLHPDAHLADVTTEAEHDSLCALSDTLGRHVFWTSGRRPDGGGQYDFEWRSGVQSAVTWTRWFVTQPAETSPEDDCIQVVPNWGWTWGDSDCGQRHLFFCQF